MELVQQATATATRSRKHIQTAKVKPASIVAVVATLVLATYLMIGFRAGPGAVGAGVASDTSYDQVEGLRGAAVLSAGAIDTSYDQVEGLRGAAVPSAGAIDTSYDQVEHSRGIALGN
jgi:hypothetical protein